MKTSFIIALLIGMATFSNPSIGTAQVTSELEAQIDHVMLAVRNLPATKLLFYG